MCTRELTEGKLININEESGWGEKYKDVPEEVMLAKNITKDKMLEADSNSERSMTIHQGTERMFAQYRKLYDNKKASTVPTTLDKFVTKK